MYLACITRNKCNDTKLAIYEMSFQISQCITLLLSYFMILINFFSIYQYTDWYYFY